MYNYGKKQKRLRSRQTSREKRKIIKTWYRTGAAAHSGIGCHPAGGAYAIGTGFRRGAAILERKLCNRLFLLLQIQIADFNSNLYGLCICLL